MENAKPKFLYRGVIVNEAMMKTKPVFGIDLTPPNPPRYNEKGQKTVGDGNEYGLYMTDNRNMATEAYGCVKMSNGTPLNKNIQITERRIEVAIPAVGIVYKISTDNLDIRKPWITNHLRAHYNNGYEGDEWIADKIPLSNYEIDKVVIGEDILHPQKELTYNGVKETLSAIEAELNERRPRLERFEGFIKSLPLNKRLTMSTDELNVYREIFTKDGLLETDLETFRISNINDCIKMMMAHLLQTSSDTIPMEELKFLNKLKSAHNISFSDLDKKMLEALKGKIESRQNFVEKQNLLGKDANTTAFDLGIQKFSNMMDLYHKLILGQASKLTGISFNTEFNSIFEVRKTEGMYNQKLEEIYYDGELSIGLYLAMKKEVRREGNDIASSIRVNMGENKNIDVDSHHHK